MVPANVGNLLVVDRLSEATAGYGANARGVHDRVAPADRVGSPDNPVTGADLAFRLGQAGASSASGYAAVICSGTLSTHGTTICLVRHGPHGGGDPDHQDPGAGTPRRLAPAVARQADHEVPPLLPSGENWQFRAWSATSAGSLVLLCRFGMSCFMGSAPRHRWIGHLSG
jgi:hypothetical protein